MWDHVGVWEMNSCMKLKKWIGVLSLNSGVAFNWIGFEDFCVFEAFQLVLAKWDFSFLGGNSLGFFENVFWGWFWLGIWIYLDHEIAVFFFCFFIFPVDEGRIAVDVSKILEELRFQNTKTPWGGGGEMESSMRVSRVDNQCILKAKLQLPGKKDKRKISFNC